MGTGISARQSKKVRAAILCETTPSEPIPFIRVANTRFALAMASRNFFRNPCGEMKLVGVTGTNGKTTSTVLLKHLLEKALGAKVGLIGTNRNMIGDLVIPTERTTPESYELQKLLREMADSGCSFVLMEVSSHSLVLDRVAGLDFEVGLFTNLTQDHLGLPWYNGTVCQFEVHPLCTLQGCRREFG